MTNAADAARVERCARLCAERAWRLASALLRDRDAAYDAVQQALLVAARKPDRVPADDPWPWFSTVLVHEVRNLRRKQRPLTNRMDGAGEGGPVERADTQRPDPAEAAEQAEDAARVAAALDALPPPEREALVLTYLAGLTQAAAAEALDVPRQTLVTRAERGLGTLARRLRREPHVAARFLAAVPFVDPEGGLAQATAAWTRAALAAPTAAVGIGAASAAGGALVTTTKTLWIVAGALALGAGFVATARTQGFGLYAVPERAAEAPAAAAPLEAARPEGAPADLAPTLAGSAPTEAQVRARLEAENARLSARLLAAEAEVAAWKARAVASAGAGGAGAPTFTFGEAGRLEAVRETNWATLAASARIVDDAVVEMFTLGKAGKPVPRETLLRLQENVEKMRTYEYRTIDKLPTAAPHNGEFTHPISSTNLVAAMLAAAGLPLTPAQVTQIEGLGVAFDQQFARLREGWGKDVPRVRRILEEYRLKGRFRDDLDLALSAEQRAALLDPALRGVAGVDLNDPTLMILHSTVVVTGASAADVRAKLVPMVKRRAGLAADAPSAAVEGLVDTLVARGLRGAEPVPPPQARYYTYAQGLQGGEATAELVDGLVQELDHPRDDVLQDPTWYVLRLTTG